MKNILKEGEYTLLGVYWKTQSIKHVVLITKNYVIDTQRQVDTNGYDCQDCKQYGIYGYHPNDNGIPVKYKPCFDRLK